jgi:hypothetical protein
MIVACPVASGCFLVLTVYIMISFANLFHVVRRVRVRVAPDRMRFMYVEDALMPLWLRFNPADKAPSFLAWMTLAEFATRLQRDCRVPSIFYPGRPEFYYMQTPLTPSMLEDVDLQGPPFTALTRRGEGP